MDSFGRTLKEKRKLDAINTMKSLKHQIELAKERQTNFESEILSLKFEIDELKKEMARIYKENFNDNEY